MNDVVTILKEKLAGFNKLAIIGVGSSIRSDDGVGIFIAKKLKESISNPKVEVLIGGTTPENLTGTLKKINPSHVLMIDAAKSGGVPGTVSIIDQNNIEGFSFSTHSIPLSVFSKYVKESTSADVVILGIEPKNIDFGEEMSAEVLNVAENIVGKIDTLL